jgi:hypothetical protein
VTDTAKLSEEPSEELPEELPEDSRGTITANDSTGSQLPGVAWRWFRLPYIRMHTL